jgi:hypothetical protein
MVHIRYANQSPEGPIGLLTTSHRRPTGYTACADLGSTGTGQEHALAPREPAIIMPTDPAVQTDVRRNLLQRHRYERSEAPASTDPGRDTSCRRFQDFATIDTGIGVLGQYEWLAGRQPLIDKWLLRDERPTLRWLSPKRSRVESR